MVRAAAVLASGESQKLAAQAAGVSVTTVWRWKRLPEFQQLVSRSQSVLENPEAANESCQLTGVEEVMMYLELICQKLNYRRA